MILLIFKSLYILSFNKVFFNLFNNNLIISYKVIFLKIKKLINNKTNYQFKELYYGNNKIINLFNKLKYLI